MQHDHDHPLTGKKLLAGLAIALFAVTLAGCGAAAEYLEAWTEYMEEDYMSKPAGEPAIVGTWDLEEFGTQGGVLPAQYVFAPDGELLIAEADDAVYEATFEYHAGEGLVFCTDDVGNAWQYQALFVDPEHLVLTEEDGDELLLARREDVALEGE